MKLIILIILILLSKNIHSQNISLDFYDHLKKQVDSTGQSIIPNLKYDSSKIYFLDSLASHMITNRLSEYNFPKFPDKCPYDDRIDLTQNFSNRTSRCFVEEEIFCNIYFFIREKNYSIDSKNFDGIIDDKFLLDLSDDNKIFNYFCCRFVEFERWVDHKPIDPTDPIQTLPETWELFLVLIYK